MIFSFWFSISLIIYCYFGYPLLLELLSKLFCHLPQKKPLEPALSIVLSVWNEEDVLERKIKNFLALEYPPEKVEILIGSDGSTDKTNTIIKQFNDPRVRLMESTLRRGKMATINMLVRQARNEIVVFTDARQDFAPNALKELVANFADPKVGCVSGELIFFERGGGTAQGINLYWRYEKWIRQNESAIHSMLGATGAIYAIRRELYTEIPDGIVLDDMFVPLKIIQQGFRAVIDPSAKAYDEAADSPREEYRRKVRTLAGNYQIFRVFRGMFNPLTSPVAIQLFSHKFLRVLVPFLMIVAFVSNGWLFYGRGDAPHAGPVYSVLFAAQIVFYCLAVTGGLARHQKYGILKVLSKACYVPYVFCLLNFSALAGFFRFARAKQDVAWERARGPKSGGC